MAVITAAGLALLPADARRLPPWPLLVAAGFGLAVGFPWAQDHQRALELAALVPLALGAWVLGAGARFGVDFWRFLALAAAGTAVVALAQAAGGLAAAQEAVVSLPPSLREVGAARLATGRAFGTLPIPGHFAALQAMAAPFLVAWLVGERGFRRLAPASLLALSLAGCLATRSLLGTGLWAVAAVLTLVARVSHPWALLAAFLGLCALALVLFTRQDLGRLEPVLLRSVNWRVALWVFAQNPWLGVGLGGVGIAGLTSPWGVRNITPFAHNTPLQLLAELGVVGAPLVVVLWASGFALAVRLFRTDRPAGVALLVPLAHNLFDFSLYEPAILLPFCLLAGSHSSGTKPAGRLAFPAWLLLLAGSAVIYGLAARAQALAERAWGLAPRQRVEILLEASSLAPWRLAEPLEAAWAAVEAGDPRVVRQAEAVLDSRAWVAPRSASWAQAKAMLLFRQGRRAEGCAWAEEAARRAPFREDLKELARGCPP